jgi:hypothetical protein
MTYSGGLKDTTHFVLFPGGCGGPFVLLPGGPLVLLPLLLGGWFVLFPFPLPLFPPLLNVWHPRNVVVLPQPRVNVAFWFGSTLLGPLIVG